MEPRLAERLPLLRGNRLLALLDDATLGSLAAQLEPVKLDLRDTLLREGGPIRHVWFPVEGVMSMLAAEQGSRAPIEIGTVGNEGMVGLPLFLGRNRSPGECFVQVPGAGWRMAADPFEKAVRAHPPLVDVLHRFAHALIVQTSQGAACNRTHTPLQRCARWLLMTADRAHGDTFHLTQEFLAHMLGERRPTVSRAASALQDRRLITYSRGRITVVDRAGLEEAACPCYRLIRREYESVLGAPRREGRG